MTSESTWEVSCSKRLKIQGAVIWFPGIRFGDKLVTFYICNVGLGLRCLRNKVRLILMQARPDVGPQITELVVATLNKVHDRAVVAAEVGHLVKYVEHSFIMREVMKQRKQWEDDRQSKVNEAIARAMKVWDDEHYPRLLLATWGWHPFYACYIGNLLCHNFTPPYPLSNSIVEASDVHVEILQQGYVPRVYPVPWSVLLLRCFLKFHTRSAPVVSHPSKGSTVPNVTERSKLAKATDDEGSGPWQLAMDYLKDEGFFMFAGARPVQSQEQWVAEVADAREELIHPTEEWWAELNMWCNSTRFRAIVDMAAHDRQSWMKAWVIRDRPQSYSPPLECYERWLQHREDLDIGYMLANPGIVFVFASLQ